MQSFTSVRLIWSALCVRPPACLCVCGVGEGGGGSGGWVGGEEIGALCGCVCALGERERGVWMWVYCEGMERKKRSFVPINVA